MFQASASLTTARINIATEGSMDLLQSKRDYVFAFCLYALFNVWSLFIALKPHRPMHRPSLFIGVFGGMLIVYFFYCSVAFMKRTCSRLEKWVGGFTVAICAVEAVKLTFRFGAQPSGDPLPRYAEALIYGTACLLAAARTYQVLKVGVHYAAKP
jgi:hypothetical protein